MYSTWQSRRSLMMNVHTIMSLMNTRQIQCLHQITALGWGTPILHGLLGKPQTFCFTVLVLSDFSKIKHVYLWFFDSVAASFLHVPTEQRSCIPPPPISYSTMLQTTLHVSQHITKCTSTHWMSQFGIWKHIIGVCEPKTGNNLQKWVIQWKIQEDKLK